MSMKDKSEAYEFIKVFARLVFVINSLKKVKLYVKKDIHSNESCVSSVQDFIDIFLGNNREKIVCISEYVYKEDDKNSVGKTENYNYVDINENIVYIYLRAKFTECKEFTKVLARYKKLFLPFWFGKFLNVIGHFIGFELGIGGFVFRKNLGNDVFHMAQRTGLCGLVCKLLIITYIFFIFLCNDCNPFFVYMFLLWSLPLISCVCFIYIGIGIYHFRLAFNFSEHSILEIRYAVDFENKKNKIQKFIENLRKSSMEK